MARGLVNGRIAHTSMCSCLRMFVFVHELLYGRTGVTGQSIPPVGLYPGLKRPMLDLYARVYYGLGQFIPLQAKLYTHDNNNDINSVDC